MRIPPLRSTAVCVAAGWPCGVWRAATRFPKAASTRCPSPPTLVKFQDQMDIKRNLLIVALAVVCYLMLLAWNRDYPAQLAVEDSTTPAIPDLPAAPASGGQTD